MTRVFIEKFPHRPGGHCSSTAMRDMLGFHGIDMTENMVFGLGVGIGFVCFRHPGMQPPVYVGGRIYNLEEHLCEHLGIGMETVRGQDGRQAWISVREKLDSGTPVMVHADVYYLDYLRARRHFSGHRIVLVGYDEEKGVAFIADNDRDSVQECSLENLSRARAAAYLPQPADNTSYEFDFPRRTVPLPEAIPEAINKAVRYNLHLPPERARFQWDGATVARGLAALDEFVDMMPEWPESMSPETLTLLCKNLYVSLEKGGTGYGGNFRRIYGRFLQEAAGVLDSTALYEAGAGFIGIGDLWTELSLTFKEYSGDGAEAVQKALPVAREIRDGETGAFRELQKISDSLRR